MSTENKEQKKTIDHFMKEFINPSYYGSSSNDNENYANGEEQKREEKMENEEYNEEFFDRKENVYNSSGEEQGEEEYYKQMEEQNTIRSVYTEPAIRPKLSSQLTKDELEDIDKYNFSICAPNGYKQIIIDSDEYTGAYGIGLGEPVNKIDKTIEVMIRKPSENKELNKEKENNIFNEVNNSLYMYFQPNGNGYVIDNIDDFTINSDKRKTDSYTVKPQNSFEISNIKHGWQYFNTYGEYDYRTGQKLEDEIIKCWKHIPENLRQNALDAIVNNDAAKMNNVMNNTFAQVTKI